MDLLNFLRVLYKRKWLVLSATVLAAVTAYLFSFNTEKVYKANARLATGIAEQPASSRTQDPSQVLWEAEGKVKSLVDQLQSPDMLNLLSYRLALHDLEPGQAFRNHKEVKEKYDAQKLELARYRLQTKLDSLQPLLSSQESDRDHRTLLRMMGYDYPALLDAIQIERESGVKYLKISFRSENPELSAFAVNYLCQDFIDFYSRNQLMNAADSVRYLERMVAQKQSALERREQAFEIYRRQVARPAMPSGSNEDNIVARTGQLELKLAAERQHIVTLENRIAELSERLNGNAESFLIATRSRDDGMDIPELKAILRDLNDRNIKANYANQQIVDSIQLVSTLLRQQVTGEAPDGNQLASMTRQQLIDEKGEFEELKTESEALVKSLESELVLIRQQAQAMTRGAAVSDSADEYEREVNVARDALLMAQEQLAQARRTANHTGKDAEATLPLQVETVMPPHAAEPSQAWLMAFGSGLAAFSLSILVLFVLEYLDTSIKLPSRFEGLTHLRLMSPLNRLEGANLDLVGLFARTGEDPRHEMFKQLMRKIRFEVMNIDPGVLLITSTREGAGKTSLAVSLAYSLSLNKKKVVIVDLNLKNNSLTQLTGAEPALEKYLTQQQEKDSPITSTGLEGLDIIGCAGTGQSPSELFSEKRLRRFLAELAESYDYIILEGPALNQYADSWELAEYADKVLPVFSASDDIRQADRSSIAFLRGLGDKLIGSVLNKVELSNTHL